MRFALSVVLFAFSAPALATDTNSNSSSTQGTTVAAAKTAELSQTEEPKICKRIDSTESRVRAKKVCMTAQQWKEFDAANSFNR